MSGPWVRAFWDADVLDLDEPCEVPEDAVDDALLNIEERLDDCPSLGKSYTEGRIALNYHVRVLTRGSTSPPTEFHVHVEPASFKDDGRDELASPVLFYRHVLEKELEQERADAHEGRDQQLVLVVVRESIEDGQGMVLWVVPSLIWLKSFDPATT